MATDKSFFDFVMEQLEGLGCVSGRKMFGEYAVYYEDKVVALLCDNQFFIKPTERGRAYIGEVVEAPAYPGAKNSFLIEDRLEDREWLMELIRITAAELAPPKKKKSRRRRKA